MFTAGPRRGRDILSYTTTAGRCCLSRKMNINPRAGLSGAIPTIATRRHGTLDAYAPGRGQPRGRHVLIGPASCQNCCATQQSTVDQFLAICLRRLGKHRILYPVKCPVGIRGSLLCLTGEGCRSGPAGALAKRFACRPEDRKRAAAARGGTTTSRD